MIRLRIPARRPGRPTGSSQRSSAAPAAEDAPARSAQSGGAEAGSSGSSTLRVLAGLSLALVLLPLSGWTPGLPPSLEADEPAYYLAAESLVHDFDLRAEAEDQMRLFESFPYLSVQNLIVSSDDGWRTLYFGKPYIYSLCAAPLVALFGVEGMLLFNMLLFVGMIWMAFLWLRRDNPPWLAALFSVGFFVGSVSWVYVFWLHPEIFNMFTGAACLYLGLGAVERLARGPGQADLLPAWASSGVALFASAGLLGMGVYNKPMLAALGLPVCLELLRRRQWRGLATWLVGAVVSVAVLAGISIAFTGKPTAYLVDLRAGLSVHDPRLPPVQPIPLPTPSAVVPGAAAEGAEAEGGDVTEGKGGLGGEQSWTDSIEEKRAKGAGWWWLLRIPDLRGFELAEDLPYFFVGKHTGLFVYHPFVAVALLLFFVHGRRRWAGWWTLGSAVLVAGFFLVFIPFNWHGGGGFVGNRYFVMVVPAFVYLVGRIRPAWLLLPAFVVAGLTTGPLVLAPHGLVVPQPTLQAHVRNLPFHALPVEHSLGEIPGYHGMVQDGLWLWGRRDHLRPMDDELWIAGGRPEVWIQSDRPLERLELWLTSPLAGNRTIVRLGSESQVLDLGPEPISATFELGQIFGSDGASKRRRERRHDDPSQFVDLWLYRLELRPERATLPPWLGRPGPYFHHAAGLRIGTAERAQAPGAEAGSDTAAGRSAHPDSGPTSNRRSELVNRSRLSRERPSSIPAEGVDVAQSRTATRTDTTRPDAT